MLYQLRLERLFSWDRQGSNSYKKMIAQGSTIDAGIADAMHEMGRRINTGTIMIDFQTIFRYTIAPIS
jgi:hypothetical protein